MAETERRAEKIELCPICREGILKIRPVNSEPCNFCGAFFNPRSGIIEPDNTDRSPSSNKTQIYRMRKRRRQDMLDNAADKNLAFAMSELERLAISNDLPRTAKESSLSIYKKAVSRNMLRGRSIECVAAATTYAACRICGIPRTIDEIAESGGLSKRELGRTYRFISKGLKLNLMPAKPQDYVKRLCIQLKADERIYLRSIKILEDAEKTGKMSGSGPSGIAAGSVYIASIMEEAPFSQREIASAADITRVTLRNGYRRIAAALNIKIIFS